MSLAINSVGGGLAYIYTLSHPLTNEVRYVGKTDNQRRRLSVHLCEKEHSHKSSWVRSLLALGLKPKMEVIEQVIESEWKSAEMFWIETLRFYGCRLTNGTKGGDGCIPIWTEESRARMMARKRAFRHTPESKAKIGKAHAGKIVSTETLAKMSLVTKLRHKLFPRKYPNRKRASEETRRKMSIALKGQKRSAETIAKMTGRKVSDEGRLKMSAYAKSRSSEHAAKIAAAAKTRVAKSGRVAGNSVRHIIFNGESVNAKELAAKLGISSKTINSRFFNGWTLEEIINTPIVPNGLKRDMKPAWINRR